MIKTTFLRHEGQRWLTRNTYSPESDSEKADSGPRRREHWQCLGHEGTTASQALYPISPAILASFKQIRTDMKPLLAKVPNPNIGSGSYSIHEFITATSLWLPTAFCLQVYICNDLSSSVWSLSSICPQAPWNHCYLSYNKAPFSPPTGCCIPHTSTFIHSQNTPSQIKSRQFWSMELRRTCHGPLLWEKDISRCLLQNT